MDDSVLAYNASQKGTLKEVCDVLANEIQNNLEPTTNKVWHGHPVWFINLNPIVGYSVRKDCVSLLFWSGQSF